MYLFICMYTYIYIYIYIHISWEIRGLPFVEGKLIPRNSESSWVESTSLQIGEINTCYEVPGLGGCD